MSKRVYAPIDEKNICTDWIFDDLLRGNYLETPVNKGKVHDIIGYFNDRLIEVKWVDGDNRICFSFIDTPENHKREDDVSKLLEYLKRSESESDTVFCDIWVSGCWVICDWYFKEEEC